VRGSSVFKEFADAFRAAFPDLHIEIEEQIAEGDLVATRWTGVATHDGDFMGVVPTGNRVTQSGMDISRVSDGTVAETWEGYNSMVMMQ
jgi:predicted ester cyclase